MLTDAEILAGIRPELATDRLVVRNVDGNARFQIMLRHLPSHWAIEHMAAVGHGMLTVVFSRDPAATVPGDFDHFKQAAE